MTSDELYEILSLSQQDKEELTEYIRLSKEEEEYRVKDWCTLFRRNLDIFNRDFLDINCCPFQEQIMFNISDNDVSVDVMSRGISKTFTTGLVAMDIALLYPMSSILITSMTLSQSNNVIDEKIDKIFTTEGTAFSSPILCQLRKDDWIKFKTDPNTSARYVEFGNGSKIFAVNCGESARGKRATVVITDEFMLVKKKDYDEIISPTLEPRHFAGRPSKGYSEEPKQVFLSSARNKTNWGWKHLVNAVNNHYKGGHIKYGFYAGDIFTAVANGIQTKKQYLQRKKDTDDMSFQQEYLNIFLGNNEDSIFKYEDFEENQNVTRAFAPLTREDVLDGKKQVWKFKDNIIRWLTTDIAVATGDENDNTVMILMELDLNSKKKTQRYIKTFSGVNSVTQVVEMKRLFYDFKCDYFVIDSRGVGATLWDLFTVETFDPMMNVTYPAWTVNVDGQLQISSDTVIKDKVERAMTKDAKEVMIPFVGTSELNSIGHLALRKTLKDHEINLLIDDHDKRAKLEEKDITFITKDAEEKAEILLPYLQTRFMVNEAVSLEVKFTESGNIRLSEAKRTATKDRYMTLMMANLFGDKLINKYCSDDYDSILDDLDDFQLVF